MLSLPEDIVKQKSCHTKIVTTSFVFPAKETFVGALGFEPRASCTPCKRASRAAPCPVQSTIIHGIIKKSILYVIFMSSKGPVFYNGGYLFPLVSEILSASFRELKGSGHERCVLRIFLNRIRSFSSQNSPPALKNAQIFSAPVHKHRADRCLFLRKMRIGTCPRFSLNR